MSKRSTLSTCIAGAMGLALAASPLAATAPTPQSAQQSLLQQAQMTVPTMRVAPIATELQALPAFDRTPALEAFARSFATGIRPDVIGGASSGPLLYVDERSGRPAIFYLPGIPFIPGSGNDLTWAEIGGLGIGSKNDYTELVLAKLVQLARTFVDENQALLGVTNAELQVNPGGTTAVGTTHFTVDFLWAPHGVPVRYAHLVFRVAHGNLIQLGSEYLGDAADVPASPALDHKDARRVLQSHLPFDRQILEAVESAEVKLTAYPNQPSQLGWTVGHGFDYRLVWEIDFTVPGESGSWNAAIDANDGTVLFVRDKNLYGRVEGKVRPKNRDSLVTLPLPFADYKQNPNLYTDAVGTIPPGASDLHSKLLGRYVCVFSACGAIDATRTSGGDLDLRGNNLQECASADTFYGGPGNTSAARTSYYHLTQIKEHIRQFLPGNSWLDVQLHSNVDFVDPFLGACNAFWNGSSVNFLAGDGSCWNTGELDSVIYHELGHGLDQNDGTGLHGTTEAYADIVSFFKTGESCMGKGMGVTCGTNSGYSCSSCDGFRQIDHQRRTGGPRRPSNNCSVCPPSPDPFFTGPCGKSTHCESHVATGAMWELATDDLVDMGLTAQEAWDLAESLWYQTTGTTTSLFTCNGCPSSGAGAGPGTLYTALMFYDDCDGNQTNGTPHAPAIYAALARHGIAVGSSTSSQNRENTCGAPDVTITSPQDGATVSGTVIVTATADTGTDRVEFRANGTLIGSDSSSPYQATWDTDGEPTNSTLEATAIDGSTSSSDSITVTVDNSGPDVTITSPQNGATVSGTVTVTATAETGTDRVEFRANGNLIGSDTSSPYQATWDTDGEPTSSTLEATAIDGSSSSSDSITVTVLDSGEAPTCEITSPSPGAVLFGTETIRATATDDSRVDEVEFFVNGGSIGTDTSSPYSRNWNSGTVPPGSTVTLTCAATDDDDNTTVSQPVVVTTQTDGLSITLIEPYDGQIVGSHTSGLGMVAVVNKPPGIFIRKVDFHFDNVVLTDFGQPYNRAIGLNGVDGLVHTIWAEAETTDGVTFSTPVITVTEDALRPVSFIDSHEDGETVSGPLFLTAQADDAHGIDKVQFYVNGGTPGGCIDQSAPWQCSTDSRFYDNGSLSLRTRATDGPGNNEFPGDTIHVIVDNPPEIEVIADWNGQTITKGSTIDLPPVVQGFSDTFQIRIRNNGGPSVELLNPASFLGSHPCVTQTSQPGDVDLRYNQSTTFDVEVDCATTSMPTIPVTIQNTDPDDNPFTFTLRADITPVPMCTPDAFTVCLLDNRFAVSVEYTHQGTHDARAVPFTDETGMFWFFGAQNIELLVKVLDGTGHNGHYWVFYGQLTDLPFTLRVEDMHTGDVVTYGRPGGHLCGEADILAFPLGGSQALAAPPAQALSGAEALALVEKLGAEDATPRTSLYGEGSSVATKSGNCQPSSTKLCLQNGRFEVKVDYIDPNSGAAGVGKKVDGTNETGYFWFFNNDNIEVPIKVLDGTGHNDYWWVFFGSLSNVEYTITVTDTSNGDVATFYNPPGTYCGQAHTDVFFDP